MSDSNIIYHYCSLNTFLTIIKNKTLRLSNIVKSNDYLERSYIVSCCEKAISDYFQACFSNPDHQNPREIKDLVHKHLLAAVDEFNQTALLGHAICFSREGDLLSQWRGYGDNGKGVAIGFDRSVLERFFRQGRHLKLEEVIYCEAIDAEIKKIVEDSCATVQNGLRFFQNGDNLAANISVACRQIVIKLFLSKALVYKNPGFKEEREVRLHTCIPFREYEVLTCYNQKIPSTNFPASHQENSLFFEELRAEIAPLRLEYNFLAKSDTIVSYFDIGFDQIVRNESGQDEYLPNQFIKKIVIGPKADISIEEMQHILWAHCLGGCLDNIVKSETSYR